MTPASVCSLLAFVSVFLATQQRIFTSFFACVVKSFHGVPDLSSLPQTLLSVCVTALLPGRKMLNLC